ncbi:MAG TPA: hypothetical protein VD738_12150, partial [Nitrospira sp.]|nr:hypothetical protein [Nitrospira sp.]
WKEHHGSLDVRSETNHGCYSWKEHRETASSEGPVILPAIRIGHRMVGYSLLRKTENQKGGQEGEKD